jgi:hypothetical protein
MEGKESHVVEHTHVRTHGYSTYQQHIRASRCHRFRTIQPRRDIHPARALGWERLRPERRGGRSIVLLASSTLSVGSSPVTLTQGPDCLEVTNSTAVLDRQNGYGI